MVGSTLSLIQIASALFRNKKFMLDEMTQRNASKFLEYECTHSFFHFSFRATLFFLPNECPDLCRHSTYTRAFIGGVNKIARNEKYYMGFLIPNTWQILKHFGGTFHQA